MIKNLSANTEDSRDMDLISESGRSSGKGNDSLLQYSFLGNPMDRGAWWATVYRAVKERDTTNQIWAHTQRKTQSVFATMGKKVDQDIPTEERYYRFRQRKSCDRTQMVFPLVMESEWRLR